MIKLVNIFLLNIVLMASQPVYSVLTDTVVIRNNAKGYNNMNEIALMVKNYYDGMFYGDEHKLEAVFSKDAMVIGYINNKEEHQTLQQWIRKIKSAPIPASCGDKYDYRIDLIDITEKIALVKVSDTYLGLSFVDYLTLIKTEEHWGIVSKTFYHFSESVDKK